MPTPPKRRWFQFRLRTLLLGTVLLAIPCAYVSHEWQIVAARKAMLKGGTRLLIVDGNDDQIPLIRRLLGDRGCKTIILYDPTWKARYRAAFPESYVGDVPYNDGNNWVRKPLDGADATRRPF